MILIDPTKNQKQVLGAAATIAKATSTICSTCKSIGQSKGVSSASRQVFLSTAKELATQTATLVKSIKELALEPSEETRENCRVSYEPILEAIENML
jgi:talin